MSQRHLQLLSRELIVDLEENLVSAHAQVPAALAHAGERMDEVWHCCLHCERFFQAKHLKRDSLGDWQQCPFDDCGAAGFDVDILVWDCEKGSDPDWPQSEDELALGGSGARRSPPSPGTGSSN